MATACTAGLAVKDRGDDQNLATQMMVRTGSCMECTKQPTSLCTQVCTPITTYVHPDSGQLSRKPCVNPSITWQHSYYLPLYMVFTHAEYKVSSIGWQHTPIRHCTYTLQTFSTSTNKWAAYSSAVITWPLTAIVYGVCIPVLQPQLSGPPLQGLQSCGQLLPPCAAPQIQMAG